MYSLLLLSVTSFLMAVVLTPLCRNLFRRWGILDHPDQGRKAHSAPIPRCGGVPIALAYVAAFGILLASQLTAGGIVRGGLPLAWKLMPAAAVVFLTGLLDDVRGLKPWQKLAGQLAGAGLAVWAGVRIDALAGQPIGMWWAWPVTLLWLIGCTNAFNLIDGVDGLAAGAGLFATVTILLGALLHGNIELALATVPLAGALLGFLRYNFNPASIFLGDSGSLTVGFLLGCFGVLWGQKSATILGMTAPLMALAIPLLDTGLAIVRRFLRGKPIFTADAGHIHHRLLARGLKPRRVALLLYSACGLAATMSLVASVSKDQYKGAIIVLFCAAAWIGIQHLGYVEFGVARRMFIEGAFRRLLSAQLSLKSFEEALSAAGTPEQCWEAIRTGCKEFGYQRVEARLGGRSYTEVVQENGRLGEWSIHIPLTEWDFVDLARPFGSQVQATTVAPFAEALRKGLEAKLGAWRGEQRAATVGAGG